MKKILILLLLIISVQVLFSQTPEIVVSETKHGGGTVGEWTELVVIQDRLDLRGYSLRDNATDGGFRAAIIFSQNEIWSNLRRGTVIVVNHRGFASNNPFREDGYLNVSTQDSRFFEDTLDNGQSLSDIGWLDLNPNHEILQIRRPNGDHVHALGFMPEAMRNVNFDALPNPKISFASAITSSNSVSVNPGRTIEDYNRGFDSGGQYTISSSATTEGRANTISARPHLNQLFWRELRQPDWNTPDFTNITITENDVTLNWNSAAPGDTDPIQGYLIVRIPADDLFNAGNPIDGVIYNVNDNIGSARVVGVIQGLNNDSFVDTDELPCDESVIYRVYAYRYNATFNDLSVDTDPRNGRGRSYNEESFAESELVSKSGLNKPELFTEDGVTGFCIGEEVEIIANLNNTGNFGYQWKRNGVTFSTEQTDRMIVDQAGNYTLVLVAENGCSETSNLLQLEFNQKPVLAIYNETEGGEAIEEDKVIRICPNSELELSLFRLTGNYDAWLKDGEIIQENSRLLSINEEGLYQAIASNGACFDTSFSVQVEFIIEDIALTPAGVISFVADGTNPNPEINFGVINNSDYDLTLSRSDFQLPPYFEFVSPTTQSFVVPANGSLQIVLRFVPQSEGDFEGEIKLVTECGTETSKDYDGSFSTDETIVTVSPEYKFFGEYDKCYPEIMADTFYIRSFGNDETTLLSHSTKFGLFDVAIPFSNLRLDANSEYEFAVVFMAIASGPGKYVDTLYIDYRKENGEELQLSIALDIEVIEARHEIAVDRFVFDNDERCTNLLDSAISIKNNGTADMVIENQPAETRVRFLNLPLTIPAGATRDLFFEYEPTGLNENLEIITDYQPCDDSFSFFVEGSQSVISVNVDKNTIDFGDVIFCPDEDVKIELFSIISNGTGLTVTDIEYDEEDFELSLTEGFELTGNNIVEVRLLKKEEKQLNSSIRFTIEPCGDIFEIDIVGERFVVNYILTPSDGIVDLGSNPINSTIPTQRLNITNESSLPLVIESIDFIDNDSEPIQLASPNINAFPITIAPFDVYFFNFRALSDRIYDVEQDFIVKIASPCAIDEPLTLKASVFQINNFTVELKAPEEKRFIELSAIEPYPVSFEIAEGQQWDSYNVDRINFTLNYDGGVVFPTLVDISPSYTNTLSNLQYNETEPGTLEISFDVGDESLLSNGDWIIIEFMGLMGETLNTEVTIDGIEFTLGGPGVVETLTSDGEIEVTGDCDVRTRRILTGGSVSLEFNGSNVVQDKAELKVNTAVDDPTTLLLYDSAGNLVKTILNQSLIPGEHYISFSTSDLNQGFYNIVMKSGLRVKSEKMIILK